MARTHLVRHRRTAVLAAAVSVLSLVAASCSDNIDWSAPGPSDQTVTTPTSADGEYHATIRRTTGNVAHVVADDLPGIAFGQGWASAQDRACDLADQIVKINGQRARYFGPGKDDANIDSDFAWLTVGIRSIAEDDWDSADERLREVFTAYTTGWNAEIEDTGVDGIDDWCAGAEWVRPLEPVEVYAYARSVGLLASSGALIGMIGKAQPPTGDTSGDPAADGASGGEQALGRLVPEPSEIGSNAWAIGSDHTDDGEAILLANPHFPWEGELRFWETHVTIPGEVDMYGVQLSGIPGIGIGFGEHFGWSHTVSAGSRFTAYSLDLVDGSPTTYRYGDETRDMTSQNFTIYVLGDDGELSETSRTTWRSHYGPILDFPGVGWSDTMAISFRDANIDNDEFISQYIDTLYAQTLDDLVELNRKYTGVPLFNTIAASDDGRVWYADTSATPNLSKEAQDAYTASLDTNFLAAAAADSGAILLDGSDPMFEWQDAEGARDPGLVPFEEMPQVMTTDYVFNANDSFWMPNATKMLEGDYSILHGLQRTARSPRTRQNATVLTDLTSRTVDMDGVEKAALANHGYTSTALKNSVVERCDGAAPVELTELEGDETKAGDKISGLPAATIDLTDACSVLDRWNGSYDIDSRGAVLWREFMARFPSKDLNRKGTLWADAFDADDPVQTPRGLAETSDGGTDPILANLARAVQVLDRAGIALDSELGDVQFSYRDGARIPIHGGNGPDGVTNVVGFSTSFGILDPAVLALKSVPVAPKSAITNAEMLDPAGTRTTQLGYPVNVGTSFLLTVAFTPDGPRGESFLTYGNVADRTSPSYRQVTEMFSKKEWKPVFFRAADVEKNAESTVVVRN